jgi:hypothetical protein
MTQHFRRFMIAKDVTGSKALSGEKPMADIRVGSIAIAKRASGEWSLDEAGVCYEVYELEDRAGYSFIFKKGGYDGFSPQNVEIFLHVTGEHSAALAGYQFKNVGRLSADHAAGVFQPAFDLASPRAVASQDELPDRPDWLGEESARRAFLKEQFLSGEAPLPELDDLAAELETDDDLERNADSGIQHAGCPHRWEPNGPDLSASIRRWHSGEEKVHLPGN